MSHGFVCGIPTTENSEESVVGATYYSRNLSKLKHQQRRKPITSFSFLLYATTLVCCAVVDMPDELVYSLPKTEINDLSVVGAIYYS